MTVQGAVSLFLALISMGCLLRANLLFHEIVVEINRKLPAERAIPFSDELVRHRFVPILEQYKELYPDGKLVLKCLIWAAICFTFCFGAAGYWLFSGAAPTYIPRNH